MGIGLAVVKKFVQLHNGDMNIQMGEDKNSLVEVIIPGVKLIHDAKREDPNKVKIFLQKMMMIFVSILKKNLN